MHNKTASASLTRRLLAIFYDLLLLIGVLFVVSAGAVALNRGEAVTHPLYYVALAATAFLFFGGFWTHGGQTLGMRTWKIQLIANDQEKVTWKQAAIRFVSAALSLLPAGLGFLWMVFDPNRLTWHDKLSATQLISLKPRKKDV